VHVIFRFLSFVLVILLFAGCGKKADVVKKNPEPEAKVAEKAAEKPSAEAPSASEDPKPRLGEKVIEDSFKRLERCIGDHVEQLELAEYRQGNLTIDVTAMDRACKRVFSDVDELAARALFVHPTLDKVVFHSKLMKDNYQRMKLYALRVGTDVAKNSKKLKGFWVGTRKAAKAYKSAAKEWLALEEAPEDETKLSAAQMKGFLKDFNGHFKTFMAKPVKAKTAIYYGVADYLQLGLSRMGEAQSGLDATARDKLKNLDALTSEARAFYKEFDKAAKSKKDYAKKVAGAVKALSSAMPSEP